MAYDDDPRYDVPGLGMAGEEQDAQPFVALRGPTPMEPGTPDCQEPGCGPAARVIRGWCGKHYQQVTKYGMTNPPGMQVRAPNPDVCLYPDCEGRPKAKGYCPRHYERLKKYGDASATKHQDVNPYAERRCPECGTDIAHLRSNAVYCSRLCKSNAASKRAYLDGRGRVGDTARYPRERAKRVAQAKSYYRRTHARQLETSKAWREANPDKRTAMHNNRRARKYGNPGYVGVSGLEWQRIKRRAEGCCFYCGKQAETLVMEHVVPLARGGRHAIGNIVAACVDCNSSKNDLFVSEWRHNKVPPIRVRKRRAQPDAGTAERGGTDEIA